MFKQFNVDGFIHSREIFYHTQKFNANSLMSSRNAHIFRKAEMEYIRLQHMKIHLASN